MNLKYPWNEFPQKSSTWDLCKKDFEEALNFLNQSFMIGTVVDKEEYRKNVVKFLDRVWEPIEPKETITIEEFRNLIPHDSPDRKTASGRFAINEKVHKEQCENLKVGDKVFFFDTEYHNEKFPEVNLTLVMAKVVE